MHLFAILLVLTLGGMIIFAAVLAPLSAKGGTRWRRGATIAASCFMVVGAAGFFGSGLSAVGGHNWLPSSFEWPMGYAQGVVTTREGLHVVPHTPTGRIQIYDADWSFVRGWHVEAGGGDFRLLEPAMGQLHVITARGAWHY